MKKIIKLIILFMLIPTIVFAKNIDDLKLKWTEEFLGKSMMYLKEYDEYFVYVTNTGVHKLNKSGGYESQAETTGNIIDIIEKDDYLYALTVSGTYGKYQTHVYKIDKNANIVASSSIFTGEEQTESESLFLCDNEIYFYLSENIAKITDNAEIIPDTLNSDGSYWLSTYSQYQRYDSNGNIINSIQNTNNSYRDKIIKYNNNYIRVQRTTNKSPYTYNISIYDETLTNMIKTNTFTNTASYFSLYRSTDNKIYFSGNSFYEINENLELNMVEEPQNIISRSYESWVEEYFGITKEEYYEVEDYLDTNVEYEEKQSIRIYSIDKDEKGNYLVGFFLKSYSGATKPSSINIAYFNINQKIIFHKTIYEESENAEDSLVSCSSQLAVSIASNYAFIAYHDENYNSYIEAFDLDGNNLLKEQIYKNEEGYELPYLIQETNNGLIIVIDGDHSSCTSITSDKNNLPTLLNNSQSVLPTPLEYIKKNKVIYYEYPFDILTKTDDNGKVQVIDKADSGTEVTYEVIPNNGYEIDTLVITKENGEKLTSTDNKITMPSSNILIEATFKEVIKEDNPDTADLRLLTIITILMLSGFVLFTNIKNQIKMEN